ncbi:MAG: hypothetical protein RO469_12060 [Thermincola sp.]|jgi:hypothetical protein|nr:hypothetical protein [Thermincola sp.]MDT3703327.1 hypothetical protein [Thermincola sp.]
MCVYYFDEDHEIAYKIDPIATSVIKDGASNPGKILVHTDIKVTNIRREKVRRTISELYPSDKYDHDAARKLFCDMVLSRIVGRAKEISEQEYQSIKLRYEA